MKDSSAKPHMKTSGSDRRFYWTVEILVALLALIVLYPLVLTLSSSFSSGKAVTTGRVFLFPVEFTLKGYEEVFKYQKVWIGYKNTFLYTFGGTFINLCMTLICAYPLSRREFPDRKFFTFLFTFSMLFSGGLIPTYLVMRDLGLINSRWALMLPGAIGVTQMIVTRTFIHSTIPESLVEATQIDGCSFTHFFFRFILPLSKAVIAVISLQYAIAHWNAYFNAFIYLSDYKKYPLQVFLRDILIMNEVAENATGTEADMLAERQGMADVLKYALIVVSTAPILCIYPFVQKYFVQGVLIGSLKE